MTISKVTITHTLINSGAETTIYCSSVGLGNKRSLNAKPNANVSGPVEVQGKAVENRKITLKGVNFSTNITNITVAEMESLLQLDYDGSNAPILKVTYGLHTAQQNLTSMGGSTSIPVMLESYSYPISVVDSKEGYAPIGGITFIETIANS